MRIKQVYIHIAVFTLMISGCIYAYQRSFDATYFGSQSELLPVLKSALNNQGYTINEDVGISEDDYSYVVMYEKYTDLTNKKIEVTVRLEKIGENSDILKVSIGVFSVNIEDELKWIVDKEFELIYNKIESRFDRSKFKIVRKS